MFSLVSVPKGQLISAGVASLVLSCVWGYSCVGKRHATAHLQAANQNHAVSVVQTAQATAKDQEVKDQEAQIKADVEVVSQKREAVEKVSHAPNPTDDNSQNPEPSSLPVDLDSLTKKQNELIDALTKENDDLKSHVLTLTLDRDSWKAVAESDAAEAVQLRASIAAQQGLIRAAEIKGAVYGFGAGYIAGRLH